MDLVIMYITGTIFGSVLTYVISRYIFNKHNPICGVLRVDHSDKLSPPLLFVELSCDPSVFKNSDSATFKVNTESYLPQD